MGGSPVVEIEDLHFFYRVGGRKVQVLEEVNLQVREGEAWAVIGPSGCGKTTFLYLLAGLLDPAGGRVAVCGSSPRQRQREIALILQNYGLFPWKTVWQNVVLGLQMRGLPRREQARRAEAILEELGLAELAQRYPEELSGGQKQRVAIARSLVTEPSLLLMDEPFSALDALTRERLQNFLLDLIQRRRLATVLVTHNIEEAAFLGRRIAVFSSLPGRILEVVDNPGMGDPDYRATEKFWQTVNYLRSRLQGQRLAS
ncbi:MAG: ABC transporter ATP-binding protein [Bacillota bacterium]|nr:ABC transporter ATP-binding protein [Bacillota bacterium]